VPGWSSLGHGQRKPAASSRR